jgi:glycine cleavage system H protein
MSVPANLKYTAEHEWLAIDGDVATVGITTFAAEALGDIVFVDLPAVGVTITAGKACGELESTKSVSDIYAPVDGEVVEINRGVVDDPAAVNLDPYAGGWLFKVKVAGTAELLDAAAYEVLIAS